MQERNDVRQVVNEIFGPPRGVPKFKIAEIKQNIVDLN